LDIWFILQFFDIFYTPPSLKPIVYY